MLLPTLLGRSLVLAGLLLAGFVLCAPARAEDPGPKKSPSAQPELIPEPRPAEPEPAKPSLADDLLRRLMDGLDQIGDPIERWREMQARRRVAENLRQLSLAIKKYETDTGRFLLPPQDPQRWLEHLLPYIEQDSIYRIGRLGAANDRLGASLEPACEALASQLEIAKGQGLVIGKVLPKSAADQAGLQTHDVLLQLGGKPVPANLDQFAKALDAIKAKTPVDAVVLRKGKRVEIKGLSLPEPSGLPAWNWDSAYRPVQTFLAPRAIPDGTSNTLLLGEPVRNPVLTTTRRHKDRFTTRYQEGSLIITVTGNFAEGKATVGQIKVQDGGVEHRYPTLDKVPVEYQDKARDLIEAAEKSQGLIDLKKP